MIKFVQCVRRKHGLSKQDFREHFLEYGAQVKAIGAASNAAKASVSTALVVDQNMDIMQARGTRAPYDGLVEVTWTKGADVVAFLAKPEGQAMVEGLRRTQEELMDLDNSTFFFASVDIE